MSARKVQSASVKSSVSTTSNSTTTTASYYWNCSSCRYKNSNYSDKCLRCSTARPGLTNSASTKQTRNVPIKATSQQPIKITKQSSISNSKSKSSSNDSTFKLGNIQTSSSTARKTNTTPSGNTSTPFSQYKSSTSSGSFKQTTPFTSKTTILPVKSATQQQPTTRIIPISISPKNSNIPKSSITKQQVVTKPLSSPTSLSPSTKINLRKLDSNNNNNSNSKPRSTSLSVDKFQQESILNQNKLSSQRKALSTYNVTQQNIREEVIESLKTFIKDPIQIQNERSKSATPLPLLMQTVRENKSKFRQKLKSYKSSPFEDEGFKTNRSSLYLSTEESVQMYDRLISQWLRVKDIKFEPVKDSQKQLVVYGPNIHVEDFRQGTIGDCWFICSMACLVWHHSPHLGMIVPEPSLHEEGIYQVFFCLDGKWQPIEIDDYFPCDESNRLVFTQTLGNQLFAPILEKALAKHHSCYKALSAGTVLEGFSNITGMPCKRKEIVVKDSRQSAVLWKKIYFNLKNLKYMISASCAKNTYGLHASHAYSVLDVVNTTDHKALLLWNPWGKQELYGSFAQTNQMLSKKFAGTKLSPGMFWIKFGDFIDCFDYLDICKINTKWSCERFEFSLPFDLNDQKNFTFFALECTKQTHFEFTIYQKVNREIKFKYRLDLSVVVFRRLKDDSLQYAGTSRVMENKVASFGKRLTPGKYVVAVLGFNHWGQTSRLKDAPKLTIAFHGSRPFSVGAFTSDLHLLGDMLIELALKIGTKKTSAGQNWSQYVIKKDFCSFVSVIENDNPEEHLIADFKTSGSRNAFSMRSQKETTDIIPPNCRQVIILLSRECDKNDCQFATIGNVYRDRNYSPVNLAKVNYHSDVEKMSGLFAPRRMNLQLLVEKTRVPNSEPITVESDEEDDETWKVAGGRGCCVN